MVNNVLPWFFQLFRDLQDIELDYIDTTMFEVMTKLDFV